MDISEKKVLLRRMCLAKVKTLPPDLRRRYDEMFFRVVTESEWFVKCDTLLCYVSTEFEADTRGIISYALQRGTPVAVPAVSGGIVFKYITSLSDMKTGRYGIPEPDVTAETAAVTADTLCVVPAVAVAQDGTRLGRGGGYYDRFLAGTADTVNFAGLTYGISYFLSDELPREEHDVRLDKVSGGEFFGGSI